MFEFIMIIVQFILLIIALVSWFKESHDNWEIIDSLCKDIDDYKDYIAELQAENNRLRGKHIVKEANNFAIDCK